MSDSLSTSETNNFQMVSSLLTLWRCGCGMPAMVIGGWINVGMIQKVMPSTSFEGSRRRKLTSSKKDKTSHVSAKQSAKPSYPSISVLSYSTVEIETAESFASSTPDK
ncbi:Hypothetical predicted protein [Olea europaea subsp. europaea]|uniref:Uncharacterized protein n=1 Tax=Olea europaea subsp. europaea TaxID=158383 RepID=A0A8S0Q2K9_OLEEU|nr:Hypothetical predicted protein [Olea europaea subsp. europaea]